MPYRIDLDGHGEIVRVGEPRALLEGHFRDKEERAADVSGAVSEAKDGTKREHPRGKGGTGECLLELLFVLLLLLVMFYFVYLRMP